MLLAFNFSHAASDFCCLLMPFANSLDQDQDRLNVSPDLDLKLKPFDTRMVQLKGFFEKVNFEKSQQTTKV